MDTTQLSILMNTPDTLLRTGLARPQPEALNPTTATVDGYTDRGYDTS